METILGWSVLIDNDIQQFIAYWNRKQEAEPDKYPATMSKEEWDEQFITFCSLEED